MPRLSNAQLARIISAAAVCSGSALVGALTLNPLVGPLFAIAGTELVNNVQEILREPARALSGDLAMKLIDRVAASFADPSDPDGCLAKAFSEASVNALKSLEARYRQESYYRRLAAQGSDATEGIDALFDSLQEAGSDSIFLRQAIAELSRNGELHRLIIGPSRQLDPTLGPVIQSCLVGCDTDVVEFLKDQFAATVVLEFRKALIDDTPKGLRAYRSFSVLELAWLSSAIGESLGLQRKADERLDALQASVKQLAARFSDPNTQITSGDDLRLKELLTNLLSGSIARPTAYVGSVWQPLALFRNAVVGYLREYYDVISDPIGNPIPPERRRRLIDTCDVFVGIYGHEKSGFPPGKGAASDEIGRVLQNFRPAIVLLASSTIPGLDLPLAQRTGPESVDSHPPDARLQEQKAFLDQLRAEFTLHFEFTSKGAFPTGNILDQLARGLRELDARPGRAFGVQTLLERWRTWIDRQNGSLIGATLFDRPIDVLKSPLEPELRGFFEKAWHRDAQRLASKATACAKALEEEARPEPALASLATKYASLVVKFDAVPYDRLKQQLSDWRQLNGVKQVESEARRIIESRRGRDPRHASDLARLLADWLQAMDDLRKFVAAPGYGKCLLVMGPGGSGKTHFVARLLYLHRHVLGDTVCRCLYAPRERVKPGEPPIPTERLLRSAARFRLDATQPVPEWQSFRDFATTVLRIPSPKKHAAVLLVVIDDLDLRLRDGELDLTELQDFVARHTDLPGVLWVFCMSEANYGLVSPPQERFFRQYAYYGLTNQVASGGWMKLGDLNAKTEQWKAILRAALDRDEIPDDLTRSLEEMPKTLLENPFIAWIVGDLRRENQITVDELPNLNYVDFARKYWEQRLIQTALKMPGGLEYGQTLKWLSRTTVLVARLLLDAALQHHELKLRAEGLPEKLYSANRDGVRAYSIDIAHQMLDALVERAAFLETNSDPFQLAADEEVVWPKTLPMWWWQNAEELAGAAPSELHPHAELSQWLRARFTGGAQEAYLKGVLEFLVLVLQAHGHAELAQRLLQMVLTLDQPYAPVAWLAATKLAPAVQATFAEEVSKVAASRGASDLHAVLYFLRYAEPARRDDKRGLTLLDRMTLLRKQFEPDGRTPYGPYFASTLFSFSQLAMDGRDLARASAHLYGIEPHLGPETFWTTAEDLSAWTYRLFQGAADGGSPEGKRAGTNELVLDFLRELDSIDPRPAHESEGQILKRDAIRWESMRSRERRTALARPWRHWQWIIRRHCEGVLAETGFILGQSWLAENNWFSWSPHPLFASDDKRAIQIAMEEQFTLAWARRFRSRNKQEPEALEYVQLVDDLAAGSPAEKRAAIYLIYHTVPTEYAWLEGGDEEADNAPIAELRQVDERLWEIYLGLKIDPPREVMETINRQKIRTWEDEQMPRHEPPSAGDGGLTGGQRRHFVRL